MSRSAPGPEATSAGAGGRPRAALGLALAVGLGLGLAGAGCGRTLSRLGLGAQKLRAPKGAQQVLSVAFHKDADATIKDVVFLMDDCTVVAREYRDVSPFEGEVRIVSDDGSPFLQAGCVPRPR